MTTNATFSRELMTALNACDLADAFLTPNNLWDAPAETVERTLKEQGKMQELYWWREARKSPEFVRFYGKDITVISYKVFDPIEGVYTSFEIKEDADRALEKVAEKVISFYNPNMIQSIRNEHGDEAWEVLPNPPKLSVSAITQ